MNLILDFSTDLLKIFDRTSILRKVYGISDIILGLNRSPLKDVLYAFLHLSVKVQPRRYGSDMVCSVIFVTVEYRSSLLYLCHLMSCAKCLHCITRSFEPRAFKIQQSFYYRFGAQIQYWRSMLFNKLNKYDNWYYIFEKNLHPHFFKLRSSHK
jgi:hypothetical protein